MKLNLSYFFCYPKLEEKEFVSGFLLLVQLMVTPSVLSLIYIYKIINHAYFSPLNP